MCTRAGCNGGRRRRKQPEELGGNGRVGWGGRKVGGGLQGCVVKSWGIDSGPFDMLICLLTALIARSSHRGLQREDAFFYFFSRGKEERRGEEKKKGTEGEVDLDIICMLSLTHIALTNS